jgi:hypothetical protein
MLTVRSDDPANPHAASLTCGADVIFEDGFEAP